MIDKIDDGGPAFPNLSGEGMKGGMSLRDWFAGMALQGLLADGQEKDAEEEAYECADAMLKVRRKKT